MSASPPEGTRVGAGRLRVDATRAVEKLREYQLVDPAMWPLEAIRAAVAIKAHAVYLESDIQDIWLAWEGPPLEPDELPHLLDELIAPHSGYDRYYLFLAATSLNAALGTRPRWVDVFSIEDNRTLKARYTPHLLADAESESNRRAASVQVVEAAIPMDAPRIVQGTILHLQGRTTLDSLATLATGAEPREFQFVRSACGQVEIPVSIGRTTIQHPSREADLVRVAIDSEELSGRTKAWLVLSHPSRAKAEPWVEYCELGVIAVQGRWSTTLPRSGTRSPLRLRIDARRLPTNASRSALRVGTWLDGIEARALERLPRLVERIVDELEAAAPSRRALLRDAVLQWIASMIGGPDWALRLSELPPALGPLLDVPIALDAAERWRSLRALAAHRGLAYLGTQALPLELTTWLDGVPWIRARDPISRLWGDSSPRPIDDILEHARRTALRYREWEGRPVVPLEVCGSFDADVRIRLEALDELESSIVPFELLAVPGLRGELALGREAGEVSVVVDGRITERVAHRGPLPYLAVATAEALVVDERCRVAPEGIRSNLLMAVEAAAIRALELREQPDPAHVRHAIGLSLDLIARKGLAHSTRDRNPAASVLESGSPLLAIPAFECTAGALHSLRDLERCVRQTGHIAFTRTIAEVSIDRTILRIDANTFHALRCLFGEDILVEYSGRVRPDSPARLAVEARLVAAIELDDKTHRGAFGWSKRHLASYRDEFESEQRELARRVISHCGRVLVDERVRTPDTALPYELRVEDDRVVPNAKWAGVRAELPDIPYRASLALERRLATALIDRMLGRDVATLHAPTFELDHAPTASFPEPFRTLIIHARALIPEPRASLGEDRIAELASLPALVVSGSRSRCAPRDVIEGGALRYVEPDSTARIRQDGAASTAILSAAEAVGLAHLLGVRARDANDEAKLPRLLDVDPRDSGSPNVFEAVLRDSRNEASDSAAVDGLDLIETIRRAFASSDAFPRDTPVAMRPLTDLCETRMSGHLVLGSAHPLIQRAEAARDRQAFLICTAHVAAVAGERERADAIERAESEFARIRALLELA